MDNESIYQKFKRVSGGLSLSDCLIFLESIAQEEWTSEDSNRLGLYASGAADPVMQEWIRTRTVDSKPIDYLVYSDVFPERTGEFDEPENEAMMAERERCIRIIDEGKKLHQNGQYATAEDVCEEMAEKIRSGE